MFDLKNVNVDDPSKYNDGSERLVHPVTNAPKELGIGGGFLASLDGGWLQRIVIIVLAVIIIGAGVMILAKGAPVIQVAREAIA